MKKTISTIVGLSTIFASFAFMLVLPVQATTPNWDTTGNYVIAFDYQGTDYPHDVNLMQDEYGNLTGNGGSPAGDNTYLWTIQDGMVSGDSVEFSADYTATPDAVTPQTTLNVEGIIAADGTMSGTWSDNYNGGNRSGTWTTNSGEAETVTHGTADQNNDGFIDSAEGAPFYGDIKVSFTEMGDTSPDSALALNRFPVANSDGYYSYKRTFAVSNEVRDSLLNGVVVIHGLDIDNSGEYDGVKESSIAPGIPFEATVPVACGPIEQGNGKYIVDINQLNSSGVDGYATLTLNGNQMTVDMNVHFASANLPHAQHIHIGGTGECPPNTVGSSMNDSPTVKVTIEKFVQGVMATGANANNADFPMTATWDADNIGAGTGSYVLSETSETPYRVVTAHMSKGADYETKEMVNGDVVGAQCATGKPFALQGYTHGNTRAAAMSATPSMAKPTFTNLQQDKYVIVWNRDCSLPEGQIGGDVVEADVELQVTNIEMLDTTATANGSFSDGWKYVFHITAPMSENNISMKFDNWLRTGGSGTIPVAGNMRISSSQANNGGATILLNAANSYSTPDLYMVGDSNPAMAGRQVQITVEVAVPNGTPSGSYTTSYGVRSN